MVWCHNIRCFECQLRLWLFFALIWVGLRLGHRVVRLVVLGACFQYLLRLVWLFSLGRTVPLWGLEFTDLTVWIWGRCRFRHHIRLRLWIRFILVALSVLFRFWFLLVFIAIWKFSITFLWFLKRLIPRLLLQTFWFLLLAKVIIIILMKLIRVLFVLFNLNRFQIWGGFLLTRIGSWRCQFTWSRRLEHVHIFDLRLRFLLLNQLLVILLLLKIIIG